MERNNKQYTEPDSPCDIVILGGTFDPIHIGHLRMAKAAHKKYPYDIIIIPNSSTYYKNKSWVNDSARLDMVRMAAETEYYLYYSDIEIKRGGQTHTIDTIRYFKSLQNIREVYFIIGGDSLEWVDNWVESDELLRITKFLAVVRGETDYERSESIIGRIKKEYPYADITLLDMEPCDISSTRIRELVKSGESITGLVTPGIESYIISNKLYQTS